MVMYIPTDHETVHLVLNCSGIEINITVSSTAIATSSSTNTACFNEDGLIVSTVRCPS